MHAVDERRQKIVQVKLQTYNTDAADFPRVHVRVPKVKVLQGCFKCHLHAARQKEEPRGERTAIFS